MPHTDDGITEGGLWGGTAAALGAAVRAIQSPVLSRRAFWVMFLTGGFIGVGGGFLLSWHYGDRVPPQIIACATAGLGLATTEVMKMFLKLMTRASERVIDGVESRMDAAGWKASERATDKAAASVPARSPTDGDDHVPPPAAGYAPAGPAGPPAR